MTTRTMAIVAAVLLGVCVVLLSVGLIPRLREKKALAAGAARARSELTQVYVIKPAPATASDLSFAATTEAFQDAVLYARASGYVTRRYVDIGDDVKEGQLLLEIASPEIEQQLQQARAELRQAQRTLEQQEASRGLAQSTLARYQAADAQRAVAKEIVDQSLAAVKTGSASVAAAEANVASNEANVRRVGELSGFSRVLAPFAGTIVRRNVDVGSLITAGSPSAADSGATGLFELAQLDTLRVFVNVPQVQAPQVKVGLPAQISLRGRLMEPLHGTVTRAASALDRTTRTLLTEIDVPNPKHEWLPGMFVYVGMSLAPAGTRFRLPATALVFDAEGTRVVLVQGDKLHFQPVSVGRDFGASIDIGAGLTGGESVVKQPSVSLHEGQRVQPRAAPTDER